MNWKEFFKPTIAKIILCLFLFLAVGSNFLDSVINNCYDCGDSVGFPLTFRETIYAWHSTPRVFSWINFIADILIWYLISCGIAALFHKIRKK